MIFSERQMCEMVECYLSLKHSVSNKVSSVNWSEREQGFVVDFEPKEGVIIRPKIDVVIERKEGV